MIKNNAKIEMASLSENIGFARLSVATFAAQLNFTLAQIEEIKVVISEAVSNSIIHGYQNKSEGVVVLRLQNEDDEKLIIEIEDFGVGIENIEEAMQPSYSTTEERMGLGMVFMNSFMDEMEVRSKVNEGTVVRLAKYPEVED